MRRSFLIALGVLVLLFVALVTSRGSPPSDHNMVQMASSVQMNATTADVVVPAFRTEPLWSETGIVSLYLTDSGHDHFAQPAATGAIVGSRKFFHSLSLLYGAMLDTGPTISAAIGDMPLYILFLATPLRI